MVTHTENLQQHHAQHSTPEQINEAISALVESIRQRFSLWNTKKAEFTLLRTAHQKNIDALKHEIQDAEESIAKAKKAEKGWMKWVQSQVQTPAEKSKKENSLNEREREVEKGMKQRRLQFEEAEVERSKNELDEDEKVVNAACERDDNEIQALRAKLPAKPEKKKQAEKAGETEETGGRLRAKAMRVADRQRQEQERVNAERAFQQQLAQERADAEEDTRQQQAQEQADAEEAKRWRFLTGQCTAEEERVELLRRFEAPTATHCEHEGWWVKRYGRLVPCPCCHEAWTYLLQCPGCVISTCPKCQSWLRADRN